MKEGTYLNDTDRNMIVFYRKKCQKHGWATTDIPLESPWDETTLAFAIEALSGLVFQIHLQKYITGAFKRKYWLLKVTEEVSGEELQHAGYSVVKGLANALNVAERIMAKELVHEFKTLDDALDAIERT